MTHRRSERDERLVEALRKWFRRQPLSATKVAEKMGVSPNTVLRLLPPEDGGNEDEWKEIQTSTRSALMDLLREEGALPPDMSRANGNGTTESGAA